MAEISSYTVGDRIPIGNRFLVAGTASISATAAHAAQAKLNLMRIDSVIGICGGSTTPSSNQAVGNTQTQSSENVNFGDLSLDSSATVTGSFAVLGV